MKHYKVIRSDNFSETEYTSTSRNAFKAAEMYGRTNDKITIYDGDKPVSCVVWSVELKKYIRLAVWN